MNKVDKLSKSVAESIRRELGYTNGWRIPEEEYNKHCLKVATRIVKRLLKKH